MSKLRSLYLRTWIVTASVTFAKGVGASLIFMSSVLSVVLFSAAAFFARKPAGAQGGCGEETASTLDKELGTIIR